MLFDNDNSDNNTKADNYNKQSLLCNGQDGEDTWNGNKFHVECKVVVTVLDRLELSRKFLNESNFCNKTHLNVRLNFERTLKTQNLNLPGETDCQYSIFSFHLHPKPKTAAR